MSGVSSITIISIPDNEITILSDTLINRLVDITKISNTLILVPLTKTINSNSLIKVLGNELTPTSDTSVYRSGFNSINTTSDTQIHREPDINILSNSRVKVLFEMSGIDSDTLILAVYDITKSSDSAIFKADSKIIKESRSAIYLAAQTKSKTSDTRIKRTVDLTKLSDSSVRRDRSNIRVIFQKGRQL